MDEAWLSTLIELVQIKPLVVFHLESEEMWRFRAPNRATNKFTIAMPHETVNQIQIPTVCLVFNKNDHQPGIYFGVASSRSPVSTFESRVAIKRMQLLHPTSKSELLRLISDQPHARNLQNILASHEKVIVLSSKLSAYLIQKLATIEANHGPMRTVSASLSAPKIYSGMEAMQEDAVKTALRAFGLSVDDLAISLDLIQGQGTALARINVFEDRAIEHDARSVLDLIQGQDTALARVNIREDAVIEHDARFVLGYDLVGSDITGRAVFEKNSEKLEVYTANRHPLEEVFGVDLIYLNVSRQNIVMLQYKMLEPVSRPNGSKDWIYRPDAQLESEIGRMRQFSNEHSPGQYEYRLNPQVFYLKFVKRDGALKNAAFTIPIDHFERLRADPACRGPQGGLRINFEGLDGRYLRQGPFLDLIRSGYIGAYAETTAHLKELVQSIVQGDRAVVAAIQSSIAKTYA